MSNTQADIDLGALSHNLSQVKKFAPQQSVIAMVKSNGYGHGLSHVALALKAADGFGVANFDEAFCLGELKVSQPVLLMQGFLSPKDLKNAANNDFEIILHHPEQLECLLKTKLSKPVTVWLKVDTGMHRLGFDVDFAAKTYQQLSECQWVKQPIHLMTHFANASDIKDPVTKKQLAAFNKIASLSPGKKSIANSAGIIAFPESHADVVRPGIMLYGVSPMDNATGLSHDLKPVMTLTSKLIAIRNLKKGDRVSYGGDWECPEDMPVGVVAIGYGDGYPRHAKSGTPILVNGVSCDLVGRVCMDMIMIDLRKQPNVNVGDDVVLWGRGLPIEDVAKSADTISYELLTQVTSRVKYRAVK